MALISRIKLNIAERLAEDKDFRRRFFRGQAQDEIAMSIKALREKRHLRQLELGKKSGMKQSAISRIEQADYSGWSFDVLFRVADALDAKLRITFEPIENVIQQYKAKEAKVDTEYRAEAFQSVAEVPSYQPPQYIKRSMSIAADKYIKENAYV